MYDVICVGGGVAGAATAGVLARNGRRVLVLDKVCIPRDKACGEGILPHGVAVLDRLGVPLPHAILTRGVHFRLGGESALLRFPAGHGVAVRRFHLDHALRRFAAELGAEVCEERVLRVESGAPDRGFGSGSGFGRGRPARVHTQGRGVIEGRVLVGADGPHSVFHRDFRVGVRASRSRFGLSTHLLGFEAAPDLVEVVFFDGGEAYIAPVDGGMTLVALLLDRGCGLGAGDVLPFLQRLLPDRTRGARLATPVLGAAPLAFSVDRMAGADWLLVGDSAGRIDPITGEGISVALVGAEMAAVAIEKVLAGSAVGTLALAEYETRVREFRRPIERLTASLLFAAGRPWLARRLIRRGEQLEPLMRVATGMERPSWFGLAGMVLPGGRANLPGWTNRRKRTRNHVMESPPERS